MAEKTNVQVTLKNVRLCFPKLGDEGETTSFGSKRWGAMFEIDDRVGSTRNKFTTDRKKENAEKLKAAVNEVRDQAFKSKKVPSPFRKSDGSSDYIPEGVLFINAARYKFPPQIYNENLVEVSGEDMNRFYPGARVNVVLNLYPQFADKAKGTVNRVNASLEKIQFIGHDERLGGATLDPKDCGLEEVEVSDDPPGDPGDLDDEEEDDDFEV